MIQKFNEYYYDRDAIDDGTNDQESELANRDLEEEMAGMGEELDSIEADKKSGRLSKEEQRLRVSKAEAELDKMEDEVYAMEQEFGTRSYEQKISKFDNFKSE